MDNKYIIYAVTGIIAFLSPIIPALVFIGMLILADWITGIIKAHKADQFSSRKAIRKFYTAVAYFVCVFVVRMGEVYFGDEIPIVKPLVAIITIAELQSLRENIQAITGQDILKNFVGLIQRKGDSNDASN